MGPSCSTHNPRPVDPHPRALRPDDAGQIPNDRDQPTVDGAEDDRWRSKRVAVEVAHPLCGMTWVSFTLSTETLVRSPEPPTCRSPTRSASLQSKILLSPASTRATTPTNQSDKKPRSTIGQRDRFGPRALVIRGSTCERGWAIAGDRSDWYGLPFTLSTQDCAPSDAAPVDYLPAACWHARTVWLSCATKRCLTDLP